MLDNLNNFEGKKLENLCNFLKKDNEKGLIEKRDYEHSVYYTYSIKISSGIKDIKLIYKTESTTENIIEPFSDMKFVGIYHESKKVLYHSWFCSYNKPVNVSGIRIYWIGYIRDELTKKVKETLINTIGYDESFVKVQIEEDELKHMEESSVPDLAHNLFMNKGKIDKYSYINSYSLPEVENSELLFLEYLENPKDTIESEAKKYIEKNKTNIATCVIKNKLIEEKLKELNEDKKLIEKRKIFSILNNKDMKTVNLEVLKDGKLLKCKVKTGLWNYIYGYIYCHNIVEKAKREELDNMFKDFRGDAPFEYIKKITYNRTTLYEKNKDNE